MVERPYDGQGRNIFIRKQWKTIISPIEWSFHFTQKWIKLDCPSFNLHTELNKTQRLLFTRDTNNLHTVHVIVVLLLSTNKIQLSHGTQ